MNDIEHELRLVLKELFISYEIAHTIPGEGFKWMECSGCGERGLHSEVTESFDKITHVQDCPVRKMRMRIRNIINAPKS